MDARPQDGRSATPGIGVGPLDLRYCKNMRFQQPDTLGECLLQQVRHPAFQKQDAGKQKCNLINLQKRSSFCCTIFMKQKMYGDTKPYEVYPSYKLN